jgi:hypothetical protein
MFVILRKVFATSKQTRHNRRSFTALVEKPSCVSVESNLCSLVPDLKIVGFKRFESNP